MALSGAAAKAPSPRKSPNMSAHDFDVTADLSVTAAMLCNAIANVEQIYGMCVFNLMRNHTAPIKPTFFWA